MGLKRSATRAYGLPTLQGSEGSSHITAASESDASFSLHPVLEPWMDVLRSFLINQSCHPQRYVQDLTAHFIRMMQRTYMSSSKYSLQA